MSLIHESFNQFNERIVEIDSEIRRIENILSKIEEFIISEADIVATTLTRAYLRDTIQARGYDTIIIDEASMAPIPAIWVAASLLMFEQSISAKTVFLREEFGFLDGNYFIKTQ